METVKQVIEHEQDKNCRLRNGLNMDCLVEIFEKLETDDLIRLGTMSSYYKQIINDHVIRKHLVTLFSYRSSKTPSEYSSKYAPLFEMYGKRITKLRFVGYSTCLTGLFDLIIQYCSTDQLISIDLQLNDIHCSIAKASVKSIKQYFRKVEHFTLHCTRVQKRFLPLLKASKVLRSLKLIVNDDVLKCHQLDWNLASRKIDVGTCPNQYRRQH